VNCRFRTVAPKLSLLDKFEAPLIKFNTIYCVYIYGRNLVVQECGSVVCILVTCGTFVAYYEIVCDTDFSTLVFVCCETRCHSLPAQ
jgi:hypothetical protein